MASPDFRPTERASGKRAKSMPKNRLLEIISKDKELETLKDFDYPLLDSTGRHIGQIDLITIIDDRIIVEGWALSNLVGITSADQKIERAPHLPREDVIKHLGDMGFSSPGFRLEMPITSSNIFFWIDLGGIRYAYPIPKHISPSHI